MATIGIVFAAGDIDYIASLNSVVDGVDTNLTELVDARGGEASLNDRLGGFLSTTWTSNIDGGGYRLTNIADAINPQDSTTLSQVNALITGGGSPSAIPITGLNIGTAGAGQSIKINESGTSVIGTDDKGAFLRAVL